MAERSIIATVLGVPSLAALGVAVGFTVVGVFIDVLRIGTVGIVFKVGYFAGCVLAVAWVRRRSLFTPIVQPPLLVGVIVPVLVLVVGSPRSGSGTAEKLLLVGAPLINAFPTMATTTAVVVGLGIGRILLQRNDDGPNLGRLTGDRPDGDRGRPASRGGTGTRTGSTGPAKTGKTAGATGTARTRSPRSGSGDRAGRDHGRSDRGGSSRRPEGGAARALDDLHEDVRGVPDSVRDRRISERRGSGAARGAARTSRSPRRS